MNAPPAGFPQPVDAGIVPRFAGLPTFMRLPVAASPADVDIALVGVPFDNAVTNRPGTRHGPRELRNQSSLMRRVHHVSHVAPYSLARVGDLGDSPINPIDLMDALAKIEGFFRGIRAGGAIPITAGGDHLISYPILRALGDGRPLGMIHFDAHSDTNDRYFGDNRYTHGTPFRRAIEDGVLDGKRVIQIGIRGSIYDPSDYDFAKANGIRVVFIEEFVKRGPADVMAEAREIAGDKPTYISFDIDVIDPSMAPGTGTPEIGGITTREAQEMLRLFGDVPIVGADVVEVSPPFDVGGMTAIAGATVMFELLCVIAAQVGRTRGQVAGTEG
jgi:guanidinopropionase